MWCVVKDLDVGQRFVQNINNSCAKCKHFNKAWNENSKKAPDHSKLYMPFMQQLYILPATYHGLLDLGMVVSWNSEDMCVP